MTEGPSLRDRRHLWLLVPALSWGGVVAGILLPFSPPYLSLGASGCVLGSIAIAVLALRKKRKDIVSLCTPIFAFIIFITPLETRPGLLMEVLYAATLTALVIRLEKRFH
jgi:membrane associated rhomboid family serine protease